MIGAAGTGFLGAAFKMKNVLAGVYALRVIVSLAFLFLPKSVPFAFVATALLGLSGDATVPPTSGIISKKFGAKNMAVLYGFTLIGHQIGAFFSAENHYARLTSDALGAEYRLVSQSGWGIVCGWDNDPHHTLPPYYEQVCGVAEGARNTASVLNSRTIFLLGSPMQSL